jgi:hypothetical protein
MPEKSKNFRAGRSIEVRAYDAEGTPVPAWIGVLLDGVRGGTIQLGATDAPASLRVDSVNCPIELVARFQGQQLHVRLSPKQDEVKFKFSSFFSPSTSRPPPVAICPDGSSGAPCVMCRDSTGLTWEMCC